MKRKLLEALLPLQRVYYRFRDRKRSIVDNICIPKGGYSGETDVFCLDDHSLFHVTGTPSSFDARSRWVYASHCLDKRYSLVLVAGESLTVPKEIALDSDSKLFLRYGAGLPEISRDGLVCELHYVDADGKILATIALLPVSGGKQGGLWRVAEFDVGMLAGRAGFFQIRCTSGPENDPAGDWLAIAEFCVARSDLLSAARARTFSGLRSRNEIAHFSKVYQHEMYSKVQDKLSETVEGGARPVRKLEEKVEAYVSRELESHLEDIPPVDGEAAYAYAHRLLSRHLDSQPPDFLARLVQSASRKPLRVLSLCCGAARTEASYSLEVGDRVEWSLLDINRDLLQMATSQFAPGVKVDLIEGNVNELKATGEKWDVIMCVSALHHVVELENVIQFCYASLNENGEFWSIGECIGRNGNRLWPDARAEANTFFQLLPERLRLNSHSGVVDTEIPDMDYSVGCFEGIRSEEIIGIVNNYFVPVEVYIRNCFLWRLVNLAYSDNYDLGNPEDRQWLQQAALSEYQFFVNGGQGTELNGVYRHVDS